ncbi:MAG: tetratricopeptide repeat protein [Bacteroidota bacterium]
MLIVLLALFAKTASAQTADFYNAYFAGNAYLVKGQYDLAIAKYNEALKLFQADYVYYNRGNAYYGKKDYANARLDYDKTIKMNSSYAEAYFQRALVKQAQGDNTFCEDYKKADNLKLDGAGAAYKKYCKK